MEDGALFHCIPGGACDPTVVATVDLGGAGRGGKKAKRGGKPESTPCLPDPHPNGWSFRRT